MITDQIKTKEQLIADLEELRRKVNLSRQEENALQESEERYRSLVMTAGDAIYTINQSGEILSWNRGAEAIYGYSAEEIIGRNFLSLIPGQYRVEHEKILQDAMSAGCIKIASGPVEGMGRRKDGTVFALEASLAIFSTHDKNYCTVIVRDITGRKAIESQLQATNIFLDSPMDNLPLPVFAKDARDFRYLYWNTYCETMTGLLRDDVIGKTDFDLLDHATAERFTASDRLAADSGKPVYIAEESANIPRAGTRCLRTRKIPILTRTEIPPYILGIAEDITDQREIEKALRESEEKYRTLLDDASDAILLADEQGNIFEANRHAERLLGYSARELAAMNYADLHPESERSAIIARGTSSLLPRGTWSLHDVPVLAKNGTIFPADISGRFIEYAGKKVIQGVIHDISERRAAEEELAIYRQHLEDLVATRTAELTALNRQFQQEIEERKKTEDALRRSEEQFRSVIETASDAIVTADSSGRIILWNRGAEAMFGYSAQEILNRPFVSIVAEELRETHLRHFNNLLTEGRPGVIVSQGELHGLRKDGSTFPTEGSAALWKTGDGIFITSLIRDISDRKQAEELLTESEARFRNLAQTAIDAIFLADEERRIIFWNKAAEQIFGYTAEEVMGKLSTFVVPEERRAQDEEGFQRLLATGVSPALGKTFESAGRRKDGTPFPTEISFSTWRARGKSYYCVVARDITERKAIETALRENEKKFRFMTERIAAAIFIYQKTKLVFANPASADITGYPREELFGMPFWKIIHPDFIEQAAEWDRMQRSGEQLPDHFEVKILTRNRDARWIDYAAAVIDYNGEKAVLGTAVDITERKHAEDALRESEERYRLTAENMPIHLGVIDQRGKFVLWNNYSVKMFGYTQKDMINRETPETIISDPAEFNKMICTARDSGMYDHDILLKRKDGTVFPAHLIVVPSKSSDGSITGYYGFAEDITLRRQAEELIKKVNETLLSFGPDPDENIQTIVTAAGAILRGDNASYHRRQGRTITIAAVWNLPPRYKKVRTAIPAEFDRMFEGYSGRPIVSKNMQSVFQSPNSLNMHSSALSEFITVPVSMGAKIVGSLNVGYSASRDFNDNELNAFSILARAISNEEVRRAALREREDNEKKLQQSEKSLKAFSGRILSIREEEKKNISGTLHDELGSMVVAVSSGLTIAKEEIIENSPDAALKSIERTEVALKQSVENLKKITLDLRPPNMEIVGLSNALDSYLETVTRQTKIAIDYRADVDDRKINEDASITLYRTAQEALNNVLKHARAKNVAIRLYAEKSGIKLSIIDDGRGFDTASLTSIGRGAARIGIQGIQERVAALDGTFSLQSAPQKGTALVITIPVKRGKRS